MNCHIPRGWRFTSLLQCLITLSTLYSITVLGGKPSDQGTTEDAPIRSLPVCKPQTFDAEHARTPNEVKWTAPNSRVECQYPPARNAVHPTPDQALPGQVQQCNVNLAQGQDNAPAEALGIQIRDAPKSSPIKMCTRFRESRGFFIPRLPPIRGLVNSLPPIQSNPLYVTLDSQVGKGNKSQNPTSGERDGEEDMECEEYQTDYNP
eukprot:GHVQ01030013.1.p1 GENE.GHVQ01030013.1~~GHVQ01030013.1.p1  ORF type:complete len:206 (-),score=4.36 GHVQ01030013.1:354-971(-)